MKVVCLLEHLYTPCAGPLGRPGDYVKKKKNVAKSAVFV